MEVMKFGIGPCLRQIDLNVIIFDITPQETVDSGKCIVFFTFLQDEKEVIVFFLGTRNASN